MEKVEIIRTKKQISVAFILIICIALLWQWCRIDDIICKIFLCIVTIVFGCFAAYMMDAHYDDKIDEFFKAGE